MIRLSNDNLLLKVEEEKTESGLIVGTKKDSETNIATVAHIGGTVNTIKVGDKVLFLRMDARPMTIGADSFLLIEEKNIRGIIE